MTNSQALLIRSSVIEDLPYVIKQEEIAAKLGYVALWSFENHQAALSRDHTFHMIIEGNHQPVGYMILNRDCNDNLELMRLVISEKHKGFGRQTLDLVKDMAFKQLNCNRLWLDVRIHNHYAIKVYEEMGFVEEGTLRNCVKWDSGYISIKVMSILRSEYEL